MTQAPARVRRASVGLRSERGPILGSVMLSVGLVAIDATILATAVPAIVADLGGFTQFPWLFSAYLLAQAVSTPIYGKLADVYGRKPVMLLGVGLFLLGSMLCAVAWSMPALIAFRLVQGLGAGAVQPTGMTIMGDIYSVAERAVAQSYIAGVWAISSVVGPTLGGLFSDYLSWRWIFWVNLPLGALALWMLVRRYDETPMRQRRPLDVAGSTLLATGAGLLLLGLLEGGTRWAWDSPTSLVVLGGAVVALAGFAVVERRAADPVLPGWVLRHRVLNAATIAAFVVGVVMMGVTSYVPIYAQSVLGTGAVVAGLALAALSIGWPIAASTAGRIYLTLGFRAVLLLGATLSLVGAGLLTLVDAESSVWFLALGCLVLGLGFGYVVSPSVVAAQSVVLRAERGVVTGANMFARSVGSAVGVAAFGAIANAAVAARLGAAGSDLESLPAAVLDPALQLVFLVAAGCAVALLLAGLMMPPRIEEPASAQAAGPPSD